MYTEYFQLKEEPFLLTPDPRFLYLTPSHRECFAMMFFGVTARRGFALVTGDAGTGKTTLIHALLHRLQKREVACAYLFHPSLSPTEFLESLLIDMGVPNVPARKGAMIRALQAFLLEKYQAGSTAALIVDEAHKLSPELLEEIRLLTNLETSSQKLLQVILAGQSEMDELFRRQELRQLKQRISLRGRLVPFTTEQTGEYIQRRVKAAGGTTLELFTTDTYRLVHQYSQGIPRLINSICDHALLGAYARGIRSLPPEIIHEAAADLDLVEHSPVVAPAPTPVIRPDTRAGAVGEPSDAMSGAPSLVFRAGAHAADGPSPFPGASRLPQANGAVRNGTQNVAASVPAEFSWPTSLPASAPGWLARWAGRFRTSSNVRK